MNFANAMYRAGSEKLTENGAFAYDSTAQGAMLDLFSQIGALRPRTEREIEQKFAAAFKEDKLLATKMMFYAGDIREGKFTFEEAVALSADKNTRKNFGLMSNEQTLSSRFELQELPQEVAKAVYTLKTGEVSAPFVMVDSRGKEVCAIAKLKNRIEGHKATPNEDFQEVKNVILAKMKEEKLKEWIREKQKTTYVRINGEWCDCEFQYPGWGKN